MVCGGNIGEHAEEYWGRPCGNVIHPATGTWEADHEVVREHGGSDEPPNVRPLCYQCHRTKSGKDKSRIAKGQRQSDSVYGVKRSSKPMAGSRASGWKHKMNGDWERR
jgi:5-methylcytosine-specific restriction endonuclease McrA